MRPHVHNTTVHGIAYLVKLAIGVEQLASSFDDVSWLAVSGFGKTSLIVIIPCWLEPIVIVMTRRIIMSLEFRRL